jgi:hypothetical protein
MATKMSSENRCEPSTAAPDRSRTGARLPSPSLLLSVSANETNQISQARGREQGGDGFVDTTLLVHVEHREVGPTPGYGQ